MVGDMNNMKTCPFCGNKPELCTIKGTKRSKMVDMFFVTCTDSSCDFIPMSASYPSKISAVEVWNMRDDGWVDPANRLPLVDQIIIAYTAKPVGADPEIGIWSWLKGDEEEIDFWRELPEPPQKTLDC
jgi:hypothetical protein